MMVSQPTKTRRNALTSMNAQPTMVAVESISASIDMVLINANVCLDTNLIRRKFTSTLDQWWLATVSSYVRTTYLQGEVRGIIDRI